MVQGSNLLTEIAISFLTKFAVVAYLTEGQFCMIQMMMMMMMMVMIAAL
jgi:hypothetical protein